MDKQQKQPSKTPRNEVKHRPKEPPPPADTSTKEAEAQTVKKSNQMPAKAGKKGGTKNKNSRRLPLKKSSPTADTSTVRPHRKVTS